MRNLNVLLFSGIAIIGIFLFGCTNSTSPEVQPISLLLSNPDGFFDRTIVVDGEAQPRRIMTCTEMYCPPTQCCNTCGGMLALTDEDDELALVFEEFGETKCSGNECDLKCKPLENGKKYRVTGKFLRSDGTYYLKVANYIGAK
ncbi:MAG: hypothetical protein AABX01_06990 [Candidatus Micrarchaeota archaeon]